MKSRHVWNVSIAVLLAAFMAFLTLPDLLGRRTEPIPEGRRIVSFSPALTETLFELGVGGDVVGVDSWSFTRSHVQEARERGRLANLGSPFTEVDLETIYRLRPTLFVNEKTTSGANLEPLRRGEGRFISVPFTTLDEILAAFRTIGGLVGREREAEEKVRAIETVLATPATDKKPKVILFNVFYPNDEDLSAAAGNSYQSEMLRRLGAVNVISDERPTRPVSPEEVVSVNPDLIILLGSMPEGVTQDHYLRRLEGIAAIGTGNVRTNANEEALQQGPSAVERLARHLRRIIEEWDAQNG